MMLSTLRGILTKRPLLKSIFTVTSLTAGADVCCQLIEYHGEKFDWTRFKNMATIGIIYYGPVAFYYYKLLDGKLPGNSRRTVLLKVFIDQFIYTIPSLLLFYCIMGKLEHKRNSEIKDEIKMKFIPTYAVDFTFWPAVQLINFSIVPPSYRILYVSTANFVWLIFLSYIKNKPRLPVYMEKINEWTLSKAVDTKNSLKVHSTSIVLE